MENMYFLHQIKRTKGNYDKGIVIKATPDAAKQSMHAYLGAYGHGGDADTDFVQCYITDMLSNGMIIDGETWLKAEQDN